MAGRTDDCAYCGYEQTIETPYEVEDIVPDIDDDSAWEEIAPRHHPRCECLEL